MTPSMVAAEQQTAVAVPQLRIYRGQDLKGSELQQVMARPRIDFESILHTVHDVLTLLRSATYGVEHKFTGNA